MHGSSRVLEGGWDSQVGSTLEAEMVQHTADLKDKNRLDTLS